VPAKPRPRLIDTAPAAPQFPAAASILRGFSEFRPGKEWEPGDSVLLGIQLERPGLRRQWYIKATALVLPRIEFQGSSYLLHDEIGLTYRTPDGHQGELTVPFSLVPVQVELFDERGQRLSRDIVMQPEVCLRYGITDLIELTRAGGTFYEGLEPGKPQTAGRAQLRYLSGYLALSRMPRFLQRRDMSGVFWQLVERPSLLSLVLGERSIKFEIADREATEEPSPPAPAPGTVYRVPLLIGLNGTQLMRCEMMVAPPIPPLGPCNGLLGVDAVNPRDPARRVTIRLLAARTLTLAPLPPPSTPPSAPPPAPPGAASAPGSGPSPAGSAR
jgi:hypothetical protein